MQFSLYVKQRSMDDTNAIPQPKDEKRTKPTKSFYAYQTASPDAYGLLKANARHNRKQPTRAEAVLWDELKGKRLGVRFRRQHVIGEYIADFVCLDYRLVVEVDGKYHDAAQQQENDQIRTQWLNANGFTVIRFVNEEVIGATEAVVKKIRDELTTKLNENGASK